MISALVTAMVLIAPAVSVEVEGPGYLRFVRGGHTVYAKQADLLVVDGVLATASGIPVTPTVTLAGSSFTIDPDGTVRASGREAGRLVLAVFPAGSELVSDGEFLIARDRARLIEPGFAQSGLIRTAQAEQPAGPTPVPVQVRAPQAPAAKPDAIVVQERVEVPGDSFTLGEIASIGYAEPHRSRLAQIKIGDTPALGIERTVDITRVHAALRMAGFNPSQLSISMPQRCKVVRQGQHLPFDTFVQAAIQGAQPQMTPGAVLSAATPGAAMTVPTGAVQLVVESVRVNGNRATAIVAAYVDGSRYKSQTVQLIQTGGPTPLRNGMTVRVAVISGDIRIETSGRVRSSDRTSGLVSVVTADGAELSGTVTADGKVEVRA